MDGTGMSFKCRSHFQGYKIPFATLPMLHPRKHPKVPCFPSTASLPLHPTEPNMSMIGANSPIMQMVRRLHAISRLFCGGDVSHERPLPPLVRPEIVVCGPLLGLYRLDQGCRPEGGTTPVPLARTLCVVESIRAEPSKTEPIGGWACDE